MAAAAGVSLEGGTRLGATLHDAARDLADLADAGDDAGRLLEQAAEQAAPRDTGELAGDHHHVVVAGQLTVTNSAAYAARVHARNPWLAQTLDQRQTEVLNLYADAVANAVAQIKGT